MWRPGGCATVPSQWLLVSYKLLCLLSVVKIDAQEAYFILIVVQILVRTKSRKRTWSQVV